MLHSHAWMLLQMCTLSCHTHHAQACCHGLADLRPASMGSQFGCGCSEAEVLKAAGLDSAICALLSLGSAGDDSDAAGIF